MYSYNVSSGPRGLNFSLNIYLCCFFVCVISSHARIQKALSEGSNFDNVFFSWLGEKWSKYHHKRAIIGPLAKRHLNGVSLACRCWPNIECWLGSFVIFQRIRTSIAKNPYILCSFRGGGGPDPLSPSGSAHGSSESSLIANVKSTHIS